MLIYDTGSGTFDVSLLTMEDDIFEVKTIAGHMGKLNDKPAWNMEHKYDAQAAANMVAPRASTWRNLIAASVVTVHEALSAKPRRGRVAAKLRGCGAARLRDCEAEWVRSCEAVWLRGCETARLSDQRGSVAACERGSEAARQRISEAVGQCGSEAAWQHGSEAAREEQRFE